jgi:NitT/TauT family transport system substrate-binding protein
VDLILQLQVDFLFFRLIIVNIYVNRIKELMGFACDAARIISFSALLVAIVASCSSPSSCEDDLKIANRTELANRTEGGLVEVELLFCKGQSILPVLLTTGQIDGYIAWQPYLALAEESGIGNVVALSRDFPPEGAWHNHPCCVLVASRSILQNHPDTAMAVSAILLSGGNYAAEHREEMPKITADWLMGDRDYLLGSRVISPADLFRQSLSSFKFSSLADDEWNTSAQILVDRMGDILNTIDSTQHNGSGIFISEFMDSEPYCRADNWVASYDNSSDHRSTYLNSSYPLRNSHSYYFNSSSSGIPESTHLRIGYLMIDHQAPLFAAIKHWQYFQERYAVALKPVQELKRPQYLELIVNGRKDCDVELVSAPTGQNLMTLMEQGNLDMAIVGITPAIGAISLGCDARIIQPVQNLGCGLVLSTKFKAENWEDFAALARASSAQGRPLRIGDPDLGTIIDVIFQDALNASDLQGVKASENIR